MSVQRSNEPEAFLAFERNAWNEVIGGYERLLAPVTAQTIATLLNAAAVKPGDRVLDVCTGHGVLAGAARQRSAHVSGLDFAPEWLQRRASPAWIFAKATRRSSLSSLIMRLHHLSGHGVHELLPEPIAGLPVHLPE